MGFYEQYKKYKSKAFDDFFASVTGERVRQAINKEHLNDEDFLTLLAPEAENYLEEMAQKAHQLTVNYFGRTVQLFTPLYISNYCDNQCIYCSFNHDNAIHRRKLDIEEIIEEAQAIAATGIRHILLLTGSSRKHTPIDFLGNCVQVLKNYFDSIGIEIYALTKEEYAFLIDKGVDALSIYQEVYDEKVYEKVHIKGPKRNYHFRLDAPEKACQAGIHSVSVGVLLGLNDFRKEFFFAGLHGHYLQKNYPSVDVSLAFPRLRGYEGNQFSYTEVSDKNMVQMLLACRLFMPRAGITVTTREAESFKKNILPLGVTKVSAGVSTSVGGHTLNEDNTSQFEINDSRSVAEVRESILALGYQPVMKDWMK